jgi:hypothetical protein
LILLVMDPLLVRLTVEPLRVELGAKPAPVITAPVFTVAFTLSENVWMRSVVSGLGELLLPVLVVAKVPLHVNVAGALPVVAQSAKAEELTNDAEMKIAEAAAERVRPPSLTLLLNAPLRRLRTYLLRMRLMGVALFRRTEADWGDYSKDLNLMLSNI